jgi:hypothetical protein
VAEYGPSHPIVVQLKYNQKKLTQCVISWMIQ